MEHINKIIAKKKHCLDCTPEEKQGIIDYAQAVIEMIGIDKATIMNDVVIYFPNELAEAMRIVSEDDH
jgi:hypothetical protein